MKKSDMEESNILSGDTIISRVLGEHNEDNNGYGKVIGFAGCYNEEVVVEDNNGYEFSLKRWEIDAVIKDGKGTFWF